MDRRERINPSKWRITLAIYLKDLFEAVRNWATLTVIVGTAMVLLTAQAGSLLARFLDRQVVYVYDPGRSELVRTMRRWDEPRVVPVASAQELQLAVGDAPDVYLGLIFPENVDQMLAEDKPLEIELIHAHWASMEEVAELSTALQAQLDGSVEGQISLEILDQGAYPGLEQGSRSLMVTTALVIGVVSIGTFLTPYLLAEEKEDGTLSVLRVSPASESQIVLGKALVGLTYCLIVGWTALLFNSHFVVHPWLALATVCVLGFFAVCLGLFIGLIVKQISTINLWMATSLLILLVPTIIQFMDPGSLPDWINVLMNWIPTVAASQLLRISFVETIPVREMLMGSGVLLGSAALAYFGVIWMLRHEDQAN